MKMKFQVPYKSFLQKHSPTLLSKTSYDCQLQISQVHNPRLIRTRTISSSV